MNKTTKLFASLTAFTMVFGAIALAGCDSGTGDDKGTGGGKTPTTAEVAGNYYMDLSSLGMNLTVYLNLSQYGEFIMSGTLEFAVDKGSGVFTKQGDNYLMSYTCVNSAEVTAADGYFSQFALMEDGTLYFDSEYSVYYGSTHISPENDEYPGAHLIAVPVSDDYKEEDSKSAFTVGVYTASVTEGNVVYRHTVGFYDDGTYLMLTYWNAQDGSLRFASEHGTYAAVSNQLALITDAATDRVSCTVESETEITLSIVAAYGASERTSVPFEKKESSAAIVSFGGTLTNNSNEYDAVFTVYGDGSYKASVNGIEETGLLSIDTAAGKFKQYPDNNGARGLALIGTVPEGTFNSEGTLLRLINVRLRISSSTSRYSCTLTEIIEED